MKEFLDSVDKFSPAVKLILMIPFLDVFWWIYRIIYSLESKNGVALILSVVLVIVGIPFWWIIDIIYFLMKGKVFVFEDFISLEN